MRQAPEPVLRPLTFTPSRRGHNQKGGVLGTVLAIIGGLVLVALVATGVALWFVARHVKVNISDRAGEKQVNIETPFGGLKVRKTDEVARELRLPVYPGAWADEGASVELWGGTKDDQAGFDLTIATYRTDDPLEKVAAWYRQQLGPEFRQESGKLAGTSGDRRHRRIRIHGDTHDGVVFIHQRNGRTRGVGLEPRHGRVKIALFDVWEAHEQ